jgi:hypothetical protein
MKNLFEKSTAEEVKARVAKLRPDSQRQWGKMNAAQAMAHCSASLQSAAGEIKPPRALIGRLIGGWVKSKAIPNEEPLRKNSPTMKELVVADQRDLEAEERKLNGLIDRFAAAGPQGCTTHPHAFFGSLTPDEWAILMYKHLDHHLRQFGA